MNFKKFCVMVLVVLTVAAVASAQARKPAPAPAAAPSSEYFKPSAIYVTPQIGFYSWGGSIPFGANVEYALNDKIGVGGTLMLQFWSGTYWKESNISFSAEVNYHLNQFVKNLNVQKLDLYVGAGLGYSVYSIKWNSGYEDWTGYSAGSSGLILEPIVGARYYISPKMAISLRFVGSLLGWGAGFGTTIGVTFGLK